MSIFHSPSPNTPQLAAGSFIERRNSSPGSLQLVQPDPCRHLRIRIDAEVSIHSASGIGHAHAPGAHEPLLDMLRVSQSSMRRREMRKRVENRPCTPVGSIRPDIYILRTTSTGRAHPQAIETAYRRAVRRTVRRCSLHVPVHLPCVRGRHRELTDASHGTRHVP